MRAEAGDGAAFMAGGIDIVNRMKFGEPITETLLHGSAVRRRGLDGVSGARS